MGVAALLSRRLDTTWKRLAFIAECLLIVGLLIMLLGSAYFYYRAYDSQEAYMAIFGCHERIAQKELNLKQASQATESSLGLDGTLKKLAPVWGLANKRMDNRSSPEVRAVENGKEFTTCLSETYVGGELLNLNWSLREARNFALWAAALPIVFLLMRVLASLGRWVMLR